MRVFVIATITAVMGFVLGRLTSPSSVPEGEATSGTMATLPANGEISPVPTMAPSLPKAREADAGQIPTATVEASPANELGSVTPSPTLSPEEDPLDGPPTSGQVNPSSGPGARALDPKVANQLQNQRRKNLNAFLSTATPINKMSPALQSLLGSFEGDVLLDDIGQRTWQIQLQISGQFKKNQFVGYCRSQLLRNGRVFVSSQNEGNVKNLKQGVNRSLSVMIEISPQYYLDAFYDAEFDAVFGNLYQRTSPENVKFRGTVHMVRKSP